jgi:hypothetical protein
MNLIKVISANYIKDYIIHFEFNNGVQSDIDLKDELWGEVFEPLKDIQLFKKFKVNNWTIEWENGADFSPDFLLRKAMKEENIVHSI